MIKHTYNNNDVKIEYWVKGEKPRFIFHSGTHGDEFEVIDSTYRSLNQYSSRLGNFIYIPQVSPSAVAQKTRRNAEGIDLNRHFFEGTHSQEAQAIMEISKNFPGSVCISFHEDPDQTNFYLYDTGGDLEGSKELDSLKAEIKGLGIGFLNGIDDPDDPALGYEFADGYRSFPCEDSGAFAGSFSSWGTSAGVVKRVLVPEIPGKASFSQKDKIVDSLFRHLVLTDALR
jgi:hypothetical protein